jgi:short-subunit dehydrogenase
MKKLIVVTGGTKGIGRAIIEKFSSNNFDVATCSRNIEELEELKATIQKASPGSNVYIHKADVSDKNQVKKFCDLVQRSGQPVEVLVNNAGYFLPGEIVSEPEGTLEQMINTHVYSAYYVTRGFAPAMILNKKGHIFNICSIASIKAYPNGGSYAIAKSALLGFSRCLREELKDHELRVTAIMPGATKTASWEGADIPDDRFMKPEDVAEAVFAAYALSPRSVVEEIIIRPQLGDI